MAELLKISPFEKKFVRTEASLSEAEGDFSVSGLAGDSDPEFKVANTDDISAMAEAVISGIGSEINYFKKVKKLATLKGDAATLCSISSKKIAAMEGMFKVAKTKIDFMVKNNLKTDSEEVVRMVVEYLIREVKKISEEYGDDKYYQFFLRQLDTRMSDIEALVEFELNKRFEGVSVVK